jgi:hypothetical protein
VSAGPSPARGSARPYIAEPEALDEHIRLEYDKRLKPSLQELSRGLHSLGVGTFLGTFSVAVALPVGSLLGASPRPWPRWREQAWVSPRSRNAIRATPKAY